MTIDWTNELYPPHVEIFLWLLIKTRKLYTYIIKTQIIILIIPQIQSNYPINVIFFYKRCLDLLNSIQYSHWHWYKRVFVNIFKNFGDLLFRLNFYKFRPLIKASSTDSKNGTKWRPNPTWQITSCVLWTIWPYNLPMCEIVYQHDSISTVSSLPPGSEAQ